jgi:hypothetical protein
MKYVLSISLIALVGSLELYGSERFTDVKVLDVKGVGHLTVKTLEDVTGVVVRYPENQRPVVLQKDANGKLTIVCSRSVQARTVGASAFIGSASFNGPAVSNFGSIDFTGDGLKALLEARNKAEQTVSTNGPEINIHVPVTHPLDSLFVDDSSKCTVIGYVAKMMEIKQSE